MNDNDALRNWLEADLPLIREEYRTGQRGNWQCTAHWDREVCTEAWDAAVMHTLSFVAIQLKDEPGDLTDRIMRMEPWK